MQKLPGIASKPVGSFASFIRYFSILLMKFIFCIPPCSQNSNIFHSVHSTSRLFFKHSSTSYHSVLPFAAGAKNELQPNKEISVTTWLPEFLAKKTVPKHSKNVDNMFDTNGIARSRICDCENAAVVCIASSSH